MKVIYEGEIKTKDLLKKTLTEIDKIMFATTLLNPVLEIKLFNSNGTELVLNDRNTNKEIEISIEKIKLEQHSNNDNNENINENGMFSKKTFIQQLPDYVLKEFSQEKLNEFNHYLLEGFSILDVTYLLEFSYIQEYYLINNINYNPSLESRKNAWERYKKIFNEKGKNIIFEDEVLPLNYRTVPRIREEHTIELVFREKYGNLYKDEYYKREEIYNNNHFKSSPIGYIPEKAEYVFDLKLESQKQGLPLMQKSEISFPKMVLSNFIKYKKLPYISKLINDNNNIGFYFDDDLEDIFVVKDTSDFNGEINLYKENKHSYKRLSELNIPKSYLNNYIVGYEIGLHTIEILIDIKEYISDNNLKLLTDDDLKTDMFIHYSRKKKISHSNDYKKRLELYGITKNYELYLKLNTEKLNIPVYNEIPDFLKEKTVSVDLFDLEKFKGIFKVNKESFPKPSAFIERNNLFVFSNISNKILENWDNYQR
ncbi:hypothetical protein CW357_00790 [Rummeliibacillus sp. TYF005]|uniref:hypothetical protein n=1 Tax=Rummeliibacillus sp. TYF005 TaxID=2058214 RepID=UPI000F52CA1B|nr:hypothetical protein [Rummeliibacillus sp. TYF005]RPJ97239.1 hypothetical protein CW357_00790 [Rummeliibacillus sp. TYF005]